MPAQRLQLLDKPGRRVFDLLSYLRAYARRPHRVGRLRWFVSSSVGAVSDRLEELSPAWHLDPLLPQLPKGLLGQRRQLAGVRPGAHGSGKGSNGAILEEGLLGQTSGSGGDLVENRPLHRALETLEGDLLRLAGQPLLDLLVAELKQEVVQRDTNRTGLPTRPTKARGVGQVLRLFVTLEKGRNDGPYGTGVRRAVGVAAGLAVDGADVQARAAADAVKGLLELRAEKPGASIIHKDEMELLGAVQLAFAAGSCDEIGVDGDLLPRPTSRKKLNERREVLELRDHLLYTHHHDVDGRNARHEPGVALVGHGADRARLGDPEVGPRDADIRGQELLAKASAGEGAEGLHVG